MTRSTWRKFFSREQLSLNYHNPQRFVEGPFYIPLGSTSFIYILVYRLTVTVLFMIALIYSMTKTWSSGKWFIYLTHWNFVAATLQAILATYIVFKAYTSTLLHNRRKHPDLTDSLQPDIIMPIVYKVYWVIYNIAIPLAFFISLFYWTMLYKPDKSNIDFSVNFLMHGANSILCLMELLLGPPSRFLHFLHPTGFAIVYTTFNIIYCLIGGTNRLDQPYVYPVMDWHNHAGNGILLIFITAIIITMIHLAVCVIAKLRSKLTNRYKIIVLASRQRGVPNNDDNSI